MAEIIGADQVTTKATGTITTVYQIVNKNAKEFAS